MQLIETLARGGQWKILVELMNALHGKGAPLSVQSYSAAIAACSSSDQWEHALALLQQMQAHGLQASAMCYAGAINACGRSAEWEQAMQILDLAGRFVPTSSTQMPYAHIAAIKACGVCGQWQQALNLLDDMAESHDAAIDARAYCAATDACAYSAEWQQAVELLRKVLLNGAPIALQSAAACFTAAITACGIAGQHDVALQLFSEMQSHSLVRGVKTYTAVVTACAAAGQWQQAVQLLQKYAEARGVRITVESNNSKHQQVALALLQQLRTKGRCIYLDIISYYTAIAAMRVSGEVQKADAVYRHLLMSALKQPWSIVEASTLDVSSLCITAGAEAAIRTALSDMCNCTSVTAAAVTAAECSSTTCMIQQQTCTSLLGHSSVATLLTMLTARMTSLTVAMLITIQMSSIVYCSCVLLNYCSS
jgi:pentatricopeptide repeat protein